MLIIYYVLILLHLPSQTVHHTIKNIKEKLLKWCYKGLFIPMPKHPIDLSVIVLALPYSESPKKLL